jgi:competence protein ComEA
MRLSCRHIIAYVALAVVVTAVGVRYLVVNDGGAPAGGERLVLAPAPSPPASTAASASGASPAAVTEVVVYVCGAVRSPGVIHLPSGARVADALELAGGATGKAELAAVNLAARVTDGQQIVVPARAAAGGGGSATVIAPGTEGSASGGAATALVNINTATVVELETLPGVGPATAQKIIDYRTAQGGFKTIDDLKNVAGIGDARFAAMKDAITV